ncbi:MAG: hypothetical protein JXR69_04815 [Candidatus Delongbacteria bacterium]|nr:hypothetical protein [Candidatus Delongbacteria bacterium]
MNKKTKALNEWFENLIKISAWSDRTISEFIEIAEFSVIELDKEDLAYTIYGYATGSSKTGQELCDVAFSILDTLEDRDTALCLFSAGVNAFNELEDLVILEENIKKHYPDEELLLNVQEKIKAAEKEKLPKFKKALKGYDKNEVDQYIKKLRMEN